MTRIFLTLCLLFASFLLFEVKAEEIKVSPGTLKDGLSSLKDGDDTLILRGDINSTDFPAFKLLPSSVKTLDMEGLNLRGGVVLSPGKDGRTAYGEGELPAYLFFNSGLREVVLPSNLTVIGEGCFSSSAVRTVVFPKGCDEIADYAFYDCISLRDIELPAGLKKVGKMAFGNTSSLRSLDFPAGVKLSGPEILKGSGAGNVDISDAAVASDYSLANTESLYEVKVSDKTHLEKGVLMANSRLTYINGEITEIPPLFAAASPEVNSYMILATAEEIGEGAFASCRNALVILGDKVSYIADRAFAYSSELKGIEANALEDRIPYAEENAFEGVEESEIPLYVTADSYEAWASDPYWSRFDIRPGQTSIKDLEDINSENVFIACKDGILTVRSEGGVGDYFVTTADGIVLFSGYCAEDRLQLDLNGTPSKLIMVKVANENRHKSVTILK